MANFQSANDLDEMREATREARKLILEKAKRDFERRQAKEEAAKLRGEDKWMLPELDAMLQGSKDKKSKKGKKKKVKKDKKAKKSKKRADSSDSDSSDAWIEKPAENPAETVPLQRDEWMNVPSTLSMFSKNELMVAKRTSMVSEEEVARKIAMDTPGQSARELNPYWKNGGTGLPPEKMIKKDDNSSRSPTRKRKSSRELSRSRSRPDSINFYKIDILIDHELICFIYFILQIS